MPWSSRTLLDAGSRHAVAGDLADLSDVAQGVERVLDADQPGLVAGRLVDHVQPERSTPPLGGVPLGPVEADVASRGAAALDLDPADLDLAVWPVADRADVKAGAVLRGRDVGRGPTVVMLELHGKRH